MFELTIAKRDLLPPLLTVSGALDRKQPLPILSHMLLRLEADQLILTATDLEIEVTARVTCQGDDKGLTTVSAKKWWTSFVRWMMKQGQPLSAKTTAFLFERGAVCLS